MLDERATQSDAALILRVHEGDTECFNELVRRYRPALSRVARSRLGRADWAEDVVQETLLAAFRSCGKYNPQFNFRTWLWTILLNQCHCHYQRRKRSVPLETWSDVCEVAIASDAALSSPLLQLLAKEQNSQLELLLDELSSVQADALRLRFFGGLKFHEIAETMQCSLNSAKNRVRWGLTRMAELLQSAESSTMPHRCDATLREEHES